MREKDLSVNQGQGSSSYPNRLFKHPLRFPKFSSLHEKLKPMTDKAWDKSNHLFWLWRSPFLLPSRRGKIACMAFEALSLQSVQVIDTAVGEGCRGSKTAESIGAIRPVGASCNL
jgi:hypothetical protein